MDSQSVGYADIGITEIENKIRKEIAQKSKAGEENQIESLKRLLSMYESTDKLSIAKIQDYLRMNAEEIKNLLKEADQNNDGYVSK